MFESNKQKKALAELLKLTDEMDVAETACASYPDAFFPEKGHGGDTQEVRFVRAVCAACPIVGACAAYGIEYEAYGFWGGLSARERSQIRRLRGLAPLEDAA